MITEKQMETLLDIKDAIEALDGITEILLGRTEALSYESGALGQLTKIYSLIRELSPLYQRQTSPEEDILESPVMKIVDDENLSNSEKARMLLGK